LLRRRITGLLGWVPGLLLLLRILLLTRWVRRILAGLGRRRLLLVFAASPNQNRGGHTQRGDPERNISHVVHLLGANPNAAGRSWSN
jgi:hypothetical protein